MGPIVEPEALTVTVTQSGDEIVVHVTGEVDVATCERLREAIAPHIAPGQKVVLDFSGVHFMDTSCLHVLIDAHQKLVKDDGMLVVRNPSDSARRVLTLAELVDLIDRFDSVAAGR